MKFYIYCADIYCEDCAKGIMDANVDVAAAIALRGSSVNDESTYDSDEYPKGPYDNVESDTPEHCGGCGVFLEQPLTQDGYQYIIDKMDHSGPLSDVEKVWFHFYGNDSVLYDPAPHATQQYRTVKDIIWRSFDSELY